MTDPIINLSGYRFVELEHVPILQADMQAAFAAAGVFGTVLLADEGINLAIAGTRSQIEPALDWLNATPPLNRLWLKRSESTFVPFRKLKIRIRQQIIAFDGTWRAPLDHKLTQYLSPEQLADWLAAGRPVTLLDTRNTYEIDSGTFAGAVHLGLHHFRDFPAAAQQALAEGRIDPSRPVVTFCTGGIRCEKAAPALQALGLPEVYQIDGGILNWFEQRGAEHWQGHCFVFDDRVELDPALQPTGARLCTDCHRAIPAGQPCRCQASAPHEPRA